jgi:succinate dehydrogenase / fumarate reductase membrane anchor subunit
MAHTYGSKRIVVGAHYGMRDWLAQRITAMLMSAYTIVLLVLYILPSYGLGANGERTSLTGYDKWAGIFAPHWMKLFTFVVVVSLAYHAWVGMRDVWMDYVKSVALRLALQIFTIVWLVACLGWAIQVLWRL